MLTALDHQDINQKLQLYGIYSGMNNAMRQQSYIYC